MCIYQYRVKSTKNKSWWLQKRSSRGTRTRSGGDTKSTYILTHSNIDLMPYLGWCPHSYFVASSPTAKQVALPPVASSPAATAATPALAKPVPAAKMDGAPWRWLGSLRRAAAAARPISRLSRCLPAWPQPRVTHLSGLRGGMNFSLKCLLGACFLESLCNSKSKFGPKQSSIQQKKKKRGNFGLWLSSFQSH